MSADPYDAHTMGDVVLLLRAHLQPELTTAILGVLRPMTGTQAAAALYVLSQIAAEALAGLHHGDREAAAAALASGLLG